MVLDRYKFAKWRDIYKIGNGKEITVVRWKDYILLKVMKIKLLNKNFIIDNQRLF